MTQKQWIGRVGKPFVFVIALLPLALLVFDTLTDRLSANPISDITHATGLWTLRFLMFTLAVTPLRRLSGLSWLARFRRMLGLFAFFYGLLHLFTYLYLDQFFQWGEILADIPKRPFITVGFASLVMMVPLAATSFDRMMRWMGGRRWKNLHRLVYAVALGGVIHFLWLVKADTSEPLFYGSVFAVLMILRLIDAYAPRLVRLLGAGEQTGNLS